MTYGALLRISPSTRWAWGRSSSTRTPISLLAAAFSYVARSTSAE